MNWEKEFSKQVKRGWYVFPDETKKLFAQQRTQLLKEVREKIIGTYEDQTGLQKGYTQQQWDREVAIRENNILKFNQLKKLKELEEVK